MEGLEEDLEDLVEALEETLAEDLGEVLAVLVARTEALAVEDFFRCFFHLVNIIFFETLGIIQKKN